MFYPVGIQSFETIIIGDYFYVDKTDLVYKLAQEHVCLLLRPRGFGKSLLVSILDAYFSGCKELFNGLKVETLEQQWDVYPVFRMDFSGKRFDVENGLQKILEEYISSWEEVYGKSDIYTTLSSRFQYVLEQAAAKTGHKCVVLIDDYDKPFSDALGSQFERLNCDILRNFYATFKSADASLRFVFLTGVMKFSEITSFSGFNQVNDISMDSRYDAVCGITEAELYSVFSDSIAVMANALNYTVAELKEELKKRYGGYHFSEALLDIYNTFSVINAFDKLKLENYWSKLSMSTSLLQFIEEYNVDLRNLISRGYESQYFIECRAGVNNLLATLYLTGHLTIKSYDRQYREYMLGRPNIYANAN